MKKQNLLLILALTLLTGVAFIGCGGDSGAPSLPSGDADSDTDGDGDSDSDGDGDTDTDADTDADTDSDTDADTDSDSDSDPQGGSECDGADLDCYSDCWGCALNSTQCAPALEACMNDSTCSDYYTCKEEECCGGNSDCLTGDEWETCMAGCADSTGATEATKDLYADIDKCVACDACSISCAQNQKEDFAMCADAGKVNTVDNPCYDEDATGDEVACFSWAGWGGTCTAATSACKGDDACTELESCVNDTWAFEDWEAQQEVCFETAGAAATDLYWGYMQCIYCDACDVACAKDAGSKNCDEYTGKK